MSNRSWAIRPAERKDAKALIELRRQLYEESDYMLYTAPEYQSTRRQEVKYIERFSRSPNSLLLLACENDQPIAMLGAMGGRMKKNAHAAHVMLAVRQPWWGAGVGRSLLEATMAWAPGANIKRLSLTVALDNERARGLYVRCGFVTEGTLRSTLTNAKGEFIDELAMARVF